MNNNSFLTYFTISIILLGQLNLYSQINTDASDEINEIDPTEINVEELDDGEKPLDEFVPEEELEKERKSRRIYREGRIPRNPIPRNPIPRRSLPSNSIPRVRIPDNKIPRKSLPRNRIPRRSLEHNQIERNPLPRNRIPRRGLPRDRVSDDRDQWLQETVPQSSN